MTNDRQRAAAARGTWNSGGRGASLVAAGLAAWLGGCALDAGDDIELDVGEGPELRVMAAPVLVAPADGAELTGARPELRWSVEPAAATVTIEICADASCATVVAELHGQHGAATPTADLPPGTYAWRAAQRRGHKLRSPWSEVRGFVILGDAPAVDHFRALEGVGPLAPRSGHEAARLGDGRVLVVGGSSGGALATAELYDPATESFAATASMAFARVGHRATALLDGRVLVTGGTSAGTDETHATTEIYDPVSETFAPGPSMTRPRRSHTATLLADGRVLVTGGGVHPDGSLDATAEVFDPVAGTFAPVGPMTVTRTGHEAILLADGRVLVAGGPHPASSGGSGRDEVDLFDPVSGTFAATGDTLLNRNFPSLALLPDGRVLMTGGTLHVVVFASAELYDPTTGAWTAAPPMAEGRTAHTMTTLLDGRVLVAGGSADGGVVEGSTSPADRAETFTAPAGFARVAAPMVSARLRHSETLLEDGSVLLIGGAPAFDAELFVPGAP